MCIDFFQFYRNQWSESTGLSLPSRLVVVGNMASQCSLSTLFPIQSELDCALDDSTTEQEKENLVKDYLEKLDEKEDLKIPDFQTG